MQMNRFFQSVLREELESFIRQVFVTVSPGSRYLHNWHIEAIVYCLMQVHTGASLRLLINQPPRSLKSICVSVAYVAWVLGHDPTRRIIVVSYSGELAAELHRQFRMVINADWYQQLFPSIQWAKETGLELVTTRGGGRYATSIGGTLTGRGADLIILDDPLNAADAYSEPARKRVVDWYGGSLVSRLNSKVTGSIIAVMQRLHQDDLAGHLKEQGGWRCLDLPAIAEVDEVIPLGYGLTHQRRIGDILHPERESRAALEAIKVEIGSDAFSAQYQQMPTPPGGAMIKRTWISRYDELPQEKHRLMVVQSWDTASKGGPENDFSVCTTWIVTRSQQLFLIDVYRARLDYPALKAAAITLAAKFKANRVLIEDAGAGTALTQELKRQIGGVIPVTPERDKVSRMAVASARFEAGQVYLPHRASWLADFEAELFAFPGARHDDQCDSVSQAVIDQSARRSMHISEEVMNWARQKPRSSLGYD
jgi:predicted phage terminase large subunit-like protein